MQKRLRDYGVVIGALPTGHKNGITDVPGVSVGHCTVNQGDIKTGVTAILPHQGNTFREKVIAASTVLNGFGKTLGTIQLNELGTLETPILLTNTLSIGTAAEALIEYIVERSEEVGMTTGTVNPVVGECNDMRINSIRRLSVTKEHVRSALAIASEEVNEGTVGAGHGMVCFGLKGGIGTASRTVSFEHGSYTLGVLVLANFGQLEDLTIAGHPLGELISINEESKGNEPDRGSIMMIVATDLPVTHRQLRRILNRTSTGLARTGSTIAHGSGDIAIGFSTATRIPHSKPSHLQSIPSIHEEDLDLAFRAVGEATEEAILNALVTATTTQGRDGRTFEALPEVMERHGLSFND